MTKLDLIKKYLMSKLVELRLGRVHNSYSLVVAMTLDANGSRSERSVGRS